MTGKTQRQLYVLAGLVAVLIGVSLWQARAPVQPSPPATVAPQPSNPVARPGSAPSNTAVVDVNIAALMRTPHPLADAERNPFLFREAAPEPAPPRASRPEQEYVPPARPVPQGPPPPPPIPLRYIGLLDGIAVLSDVRGTPIYGKEGDIIEGRYRVLRVGGDAIEIAYLDGRGRTTLRLTIQ